MYDFIDKMLKNKKGQTIKPECVLHLMTALTV